MFIRLAILALLIALAGGCTFHRSGSQAVEVNPFGTGLGDSMIAPANDHQFWNGDPMSYRD